jgi:hypothetical protein
MFIDGVIAAGLTTGITSGALTSSPLTSSPLTTSPLTTSPLTTGAISTGAISTGSISTGSVTSGGPGFPQNGVLIFADPYQSEFAGVIKATEIYGSPITSIIARPVISGTKVGAFAYNQNYNSTTLVYLDLQTKLFFSYNLINNQFYNLSTTPIAIDYDPNTHYMSQAPNGSVYCK